MASLQEIEAYIRQAAQRRGIDPDTAVRVARSEGLAPDTWQSNVVKNGKRETSYGPFQLMEGGGLGDKFAQKYGRSASDPSTVFQQVDFALDEAKSGGWSPWYGAKKVGVDNWTGIRGGAGSDNMVGSAGQDNMSTDWLRYANAGATRSQPLDPRLVDSLGFLKDLGVTMEVFSGGQPESGPGRVGSHRHDKGGAADALFYKDGRQLDWASDADRPLFEEIVRRGKSRGITGFGAGPNYMRPGSMHLGFGSPAVWGAGGSGDNAPEWLRSAYGQPPKNLSGVGSPSIFGSMSPGGGGQPMAGPPAEGAQWALSPKTPGLGERLQGAGAAFSRAAKAYPAPNISGGGADARASGSDLIKLLMKDPAALAHALLGKRMA